MNETTAIQVGEAATQRPHIPAGDTRARKLECFWHDVRYGARVLYKKPVFTIIAILTLALGIGANTAIFSVVNASLLTPIPVPDPDRVTMVWTDRVAQGSTGFPASVPDFVDLRNSHMFEALAGFNTEGFNLSIGNNAVRVEGLSVTSEWFQILRAQPYLGRVFRPDDMHPGHDHVTLLSYKLWFSQFAADPTVVGKTTIINSTPYTIIGVLPKKIAKLANEDIYVPLVFEPPLANERGIRLVGAVGRLAPDISFAAAKTSIAALGVRLAKEFPNEDGGETFRLQRIEEAYVEDVHALLWVLFGAVGFVLLIACANIANLLLVRGTARRKELAIRAALGGSRRRLASQLLTESVVLSVLGGLAGLIPALVGIRLLVTLKPEALPNADLIKLDPVVLLFTLMLSVCTGIFFGAIPAWQAWRTNVSTPLRDRSQASGRELKFGNLLVIAEVALTLILVAGATLMLRSFVRLRSANPGYDSQHVLTMRVSLSGKQYDKPERQIEFYRDLLARLQQLPGVRSAAAIDALPTSDDITGGTLHFTDRPEPKKSDAAIVVIGSVTPEFFDAMRIPLVRGRVFSDADGASDQLTVILDEATARRYWPNRDPIGQLVRLRLKDPLRRIIGIVGNIDRSIAAKVKARIGQVYVPFAQAPNPQHLPNPEMSLVVSCNADPHSMISSVRRVIASLAPDQPVFQVQTMAEARATGQMSSRFATWLLGLFALLSLLLAAVGIYGVISYSVEQRTREIGVRMALGASAFDVLFAALARGLLLTLIGLAFGLAGALILTRTMGTLLHGLSAVDPTSFCAAALVLVAVGLFATYVPARRASKVQPLAALRHE